MEVHQFGDLFDSPPPTHPDGMVRAWSHGGDYTGEMLSSYTSKLAGTILYGAPGAQRLP
jgi:hypothetical protein